MRLTLKAFLTSPTIPFCRFVICCCVRERKLSQKNFPQRCCVYIDDEILHRHEFGKRNENFHPVDIQFLIEKGDLVTVRYQIKLRCFSLHENTIKKEEFEELRNKNCAKRILIKIN